MARTTLFGKVAEKASKVTTGARTTGKTGAKGGTARKPAAKKPPAGKPGSKKPGTGKTATTKTDADPARKTPRRTPGKRRDDSAPAPPARGQPPLAVRVLVMIVAFAAMVAFAVVLAKLTLVPSAASEPLTHSNLRPGDSIRDYVSQPAFRDTVKQIGGNVLLGLPFGVLLPVLLPKARGPLRVVLVTALVMAMVELAQGALVTGRAFDIDDVILNTTGALLGYIFLGRRLGRALHPRRPHWWQRRPRETTPSN